VVVGTHCLRACLFHSTTATMWAERVGLGVTLRALVRHLVSLALRVILYANTILYPVSVYVDLFYTPLNDYNPIFESGGKADRR